MRATAVLAVLLILAAGGLYGLLFFGDPDATGELDRRVYERASAGTHWESGGAVCQGPHQVPIELFICIRDHHRRKLGKCPRLERVAFGTDRLGRPTVSMEGSTPYCDGEPAGRFGVGMTQVGQR